MTDHNSQYARRLTALRHLMQEQELDALIVPHDDEYLSYELNPDGERLAYLTGFTGSAGFAVVLQETEEDSEAADEEKPQAAVFTDGRYTVQVQQQTDAQLFETFNIRTTKPWQYLAERLPSGSKAGLCLQFVSYSTYLKFVQELDKHGIEVVALQESLVDKIWQDRPLPVLSAVQIYPDEYNGCPSLQKRQNLARTLREEGLDATIISSPEAICWLLNIRGRDRHCLPVINCRLVAYANEAIEWYVNSAHLTDEIQGELEQHFGHVDIFPEERFDDMLERLCQGHCRVYTDPAATNARIMQKLQEGGAIVIEGTGLCELPKACKNDIEIAGEHKAHLKDGVAMCRFLTWLDEVTELDKPCSPEVFRDRTRGITEATLSDKAEDLRQVEGEYIEPSFDTISALGPNASMCHYNHVNSAEPPRELGTDAMYLIDSGAHYLEGTTDITRTVQVGQNPSAEMKKLFTTVLRCHIALASAIFPEGTCGQQLDALARRPLWELGLDYEHGTGHGVGHLLCVHEGPQNISSHGSQVPLMPGMVVSIEPGYYKAGEYGIRLENLVVVRRCSKPGFEHMLCFEPLTLVPFDRRLIVRDLLTGRERDYLNNYHQHVHNLITAAGTTLSDFELSWLANATAPL